MLDHSMVLLTQNLLVGCRSRVLRLPYLQLMSEKDISEASILMGPIPLKHVPNTEVL